MNRWDLFTYAAVGFLVAGSVVVFGFFLRDARRILKEMGREGERPGGARTGAARPDPAGDRREPGD
jgi:hypothetical protein